MLCKCGHEQAEPRGAEPREISCEQCGRRGCWCYLDANPIVRASLEYRHKQVVEFLTKPFPSGNKEATP